MDEEEGDRLGVDDVAVVIVRLDRRIMGKS